MKQHSAGKIAAFLMITAAVCLSPVRVQASSDTTAAASATTSATTDSTSPGTSATTTAPPSDDDVPEVSVSSNAQETLGTVGFSEANTKRIAVGKSTTLYLTIKDMGYSYKTAFTSSDTSIATVERIDNRAVKVVGIKNGTVTITATVSINGVETDKIAKYELIVGDSDVSSDSAVSNAASQDDVSNGGIITDYNDNDLDLFSSTTDPMLAKYASARTNTNATSLLLGLIAWIFIISAVVYVFSIVISLRTPKMNVSPGTRKRYSTGGSGSPRAGNRLLPDKYYRNLKKY